MITYLITGGAGFIGSNFVSYMLNYYKDIKLIILDNLTYAGTLKNLEKELKDDRVIFIQGDICDKKIVSEIFENYDLNYVVNFAAESHVDNSILYPEIFAKTNVEGTVNLLGNACKFWANNYENKKFIQISTDEVYGSLENEDSDIFTETTSIKPRSPYSASKASADFFVKAFHSTYGLPINITRCSNNYGKNQHVEKLIPTIISNMLSEKPVPIYGDGLQIRDWLCVEDHCSAIDLVIHHGINGEVYNVGGNNEIKNLDMVNLIGEYMVKNEVIQQYYIKHVEDRKGHDRRYAICSKKIQEELGWKPKIDFEKGIQLTIDWYLHHLERIKQ